MLQLVTVNHQERILIHFHLSAGAKKSNLRYDFSLFPRTHSVHASTSFFQFQSSYGIIGGGNTWHVLEKKKIGCTEMIGGKLHTVSKLQVRLKRKREGGTILDSDTRGVWADMKYYECSIGGVKAEASGTSTRTSIAVNRDRSVLENPHLIVGEDALEALSGPQLPKSCSRFHGKPKACCETKCLYSKSHRCLTEEEFDPLKLGRDECETIDPLSTITDETDLFGDGDDTPGLFDDAAFPVHSILSNGYVKSKGTQVYTLDDEVIDALRVIGLETSPRPTRAQIESKEPASGLSARDAAWFNLQKTYLLSQDFEGDDGPIMKSSVRDRLFGRNMIFNCIDYSGLKANSLNAMETCERADQPGIPVEHIGIGRNRPSPFSGGPSPFSGGEGESTPRRREVDVLHSAPCETFLSAKETADAIPEGDDLKEGTSLSLSLSLSLSIQQQQITQKQPWNEQKESRHMHVFRKSVGATRAQKRYQKVSDIIHFRPSQKIVYLIHNHYRTVTYPIIN